MYLKDSLKVQSKYPNLEASFPSFLPYTPEQQRLPLQPAFKVHTRRRHGRTPVCLAKVLPYVSSHTAQDA